MKTTIMILLFVCSIAANAKMDEKVYKWPAISSIPGPIVVALPSLRAAANDAYQLALINVAQEKESEIKEGLKPGFHSCSQEFKIAAYREAPDFLSSTKKAYLISVFCGSVEAHHYDANILILVYINSNGAIKYLWPLETPGNERKSEQFVETKKEYINCQAFRIAEDKIGIAIETEKYNFAGPYILIYEVTSSSSKLVLEDHGNILHLEPERDFASFNYTNAICYFDKFDGSDSIGVLFVKTVSEVKQYSSYVFSYKTGRFEAGSEAYTINAREQLLRQKKTIPILECKNE